MSHFFDEIVRAGIDAVREMEGISPESAKLQADAEGVLSGTEEEIVELPDLPSLGSSGTTMTNFDHDIPNEMEERLRDGNMGNHPAWNFYGYVWYADGQFHEQVWKDQSPVAQFCAPTLRDLMRLANDAYGWD